MSIVFTLRTEFEFDSAHFLRGYKGKCADMHGHTWKAEIWVRGRDRNQVGIVWDFANRKELKELLDHKCLNDVLGDINPTAENICEYVLCWLDDHYNPIGTKPLRFKVRIWESRNSSVEAGDW